MLHRWGGVRSQIFASVDCGIEIKYEIGCVGAPRAQGLSMLPTGGVPVEELM